MNIHLSLIFCVCFVSVGYSQTNPANGLRFTGGFYQPDDAFVVDIDTDSGSIQCDTAIDWHTEEGLKSRRKLSIQCTQPEKQILQRLIRNYEYCNNGAEGVIGSGLSTDAVLYREGEESVRFHYFGIDQSQYFSVRAAEIPELLIRLSDHGKALNEQSRNAFFAYLDSLASAIEEWKIAESELKKHYAAGTKPDWETLLPKVYSACAMPVDFPTEKSVDLKTALEQVLTELMQSKALSETGLINQQADHYIIKCHWIYFREPMVSYWIPLCSNSKSQDNRWIAPPNVLRQFLATFVYDQPPSQANRGITIDLTLETPDRDNDETVNYSFFDKPELPEEGKQRLQFLRQSNLVPFLFGQNRLISEPAVLDIDMLTIEESLNNMVFNSQSPKPPNETLVIEAVKEGGKWEIKPPMSEEEWRKLGKW